MPELEVMSWDEAGCRERQYSPNGPTNDFVRLYALARQEKARAEKAEAALAECYRLTGADPDGNEDWRLAKHAVKEVQRTREELDAAEASLALADRLAEAVGNLPVPSNKELGYAQTNVWNIQDILESRRAYEESRK